MTDTDLIAAGSGAEEPDLPTTATSEVTTPAPVDVPSECPTRHGALATMVLPELRALANEVGVKGTSGMRKNELIAAIRERRGEPNGKAHNGEARHPTTPAAAKRTATASSEPSRRDAKPQRTRRRQAGQATSPAGQSRCRQVDRRKSQAGRAVKAATEASAQGGDQHGGGQNRGDDDGEGRRAAGGAADSATAGAGNVAAATAAVRPNCARTTWSSPWPASSTFSTTTHSFARPAIWQAPTTSTCR